MKVDLKQLLPRLNPQCKHALEAASGLCVNNANYEVSVHHMLHALLEDSHGDLQAALRHHEIDAADWAKRVQAEIEGLKTGNPGKPVFATALVRLFEAGWMQASLNLGLAQTRSGVLLAVLADNPMHYGVEYLHELSTMGAENLLRDFDKVFGNSTEAATPVGTAAAAGAAPGAAPGAGGDTAIARFCTNFTQRARDGLIDPVFGRDREIRQMIDILGRRRKNNPIAVGEAGVGKTAVVEGLALKVAEGDVPEIIAGVDILGLDLGLLQAGASVKGEFENRLNAVITEIKASETPIILFIDEAHTLIGAGGAAGTGDAANLLKPALARGELRTVAATTWSEYKKYFEKDPALARRFQLVKLDEPSPDEAVVILRGLRDVYEGAHGVYVRDEAIVAAAQLSARYVSGRQLPDKAVDVLDTACARVQISLTTKPDRVEDLERRVQTLERERAALARDIDSGRSSDRAALDEVEASIVTLQGELGEATEAWRTEKAAVDEVVALRRERNEADETAAAEVDARLNAALEKLAAVQGERALVDYEVTAAVVARVVSDWTGVPLGNIVKDEASALLGFNEDMKRWVRGQDHCVDVLDAAIRTAKAGMHNPDQPMGVFLFVGPSGVGKTETALGVANLLFGGDRFMVTVNMSEYQEKHTVSRLVGSPAGYVGFGEGGVLTEAVRQRPYSVVLLDEVEKADLEVMNLFYQVFDKGNLSDGEGRVIDFRNTIVLLTSNLASDIIMAMCEDDAAPSVEAMTEAIRPVLQQHFKPALLARMNVVPFYPLRGEALKSIVRIKLDKVGRRLTASHKLAFDYDDAVVDAIAERCTDIESGARNIDHIVNRTLLPMIATEILQRIGEEQDFTRLALRIGERGEFEPAFSA